MFHEGELLAGKYRVERLLGTGGMGVVVAARHVQLDERVAIKFLRPEMMARPHAAARFLREARAAVRIKNEHVARVFDVGALETGAPYIVMEHLAGCDLAAWLAERGPLPVEEAVDFVLQSCMALAEAHALGIVHRDLKPSNLFCARRADGAVCIKVLDFGISKILTPLGDPSTLDATGEAAVLGSPFYMSPEQMQRAPDVDARADIWALGVVLYQLVTGYQPFGGATIPEVCMKVAGGLPESLLALRPDAPPALDAVVRRCLEKDRTRRYANVSELARALADLAPSEKAEEAWEGASSWSPARPRRAGALVATSAAAAALAIGIGLLRFGGPAGAAPARAMPPEVTVAASAPVAAEPAPAPASTELSTKGLAPDSPTRRPATAVHVAEAPSRIAGPTRSARAQATAPTPASPASATSAAQTVPSASSVRAPAPSAPAGATSLIDSRR